MNLPDSIKRILADNKSGSVTLLNRLTIVLENELLDPELNAATFISWIELIKKKLSTFTVVMHFCDELLLSEQISSRNHLENFLAFISEYREFWERAPQRIAANLKGIIDLKNKAVMLHSNSGTIRMVFQSLKGEYEDLSIYQTLSAPAEEGSIQAQNLADMGYKVVMIADALSAEMMKGTDYLILGADQVTHFSIINKIGSLQLVLAARHFGVPVVVLAESRKMSKDEEHPFRDEMRDPEEVLTDIHRNENISAINLYFEEIPVTMIDYIITEK